MDPAWAFSRCFARRLSPLPPPSPACVSASASALRGQLRAPRPLVDIGGCRLAADHHCRERESSRWPYSRGIVFGYGQRTTVPTRLTMIDVRASLFFSGRDGTVVHLCRKRPMSLNSCQLTLDCGQQWKGAPSLNSRTTEIIPFIVDMFDRCAGVLVFGVHT